MHANDTQIRGWWAGWGFLTQISANVTQIRDGGLDGDFEHKLAQITHKLEDSSYKANRADKAYRVGYAEVWNGEWW